ncbi:MAG: class I SAM-dependent methyltransferase [Reichenbachiella sp.]
MEKFDRKKHWENIYQTKELKDVSWYQPTPQTSLKFVEQANLSKTAKIIDIGGGDSFFVDHLLDMGYQDITILDISSSSLERAKKRLGNQADRIKWVVSDIVQFEPTEQYDFWHDRATFHFLTDEDEISNYLSTIEHCISPGGTIVIGTFSDQGPKKCSGIEIKQYSESTLSDKFKDSFTKENCIIINHPTPFETQQNFVFCSFKKATSIKIKKHSISS